MTTLACLMHWYTSAMYVVPTGAVGAWGWWSSRRMGEGENGEPAREGETPSPRD